MPNFQGILFHGLLYNLGHETIFADQEFTVDHVIHRKHLVGYYVRLLMHLVLYGSMMHDISNRVASKTAIIRLHAQTLALHEYT